MRSDQLSQVVQGTEAIVLDMTVTKASTIDRSVFTMGCPDS